MKPTLNEQLIRMQKLAGIIKENQVTEATGVKIVDDTIEKLKNLKSTDPSNAQKELKSVLTYISNYGTRNEGSAAEAVYNKVKAILTALEGGKDMRAAIDMTIANLLNFEDDMNEGSNTNMLDFSSWKRIMGDDDMYQMVPPSKNTEEVLDVRVYPSKNKVMIASNDDIMIQTIADKYNSEVYQEMAPSIYQVNLKLTDLATLFPGQDFFLDDMNEGEGAYKDSKVSFGKFKNVEYYKVDNELYLVVTNSDNFKEIENSMDFGDRDYLKDKEKSFLNNTVDKLADEMSNYLTSIGVKNEVGDNPIGYGQEIDNLIVVIDPNDLSKLNNTQMSEGDTDYDRAKSAKRLGKKGEENIYGAGVKKGEEIEKEKMTKSKLKSKIKEMILAELNEDSTEDIDEPGALNNMYDPLAEAEEIELEDNNYDATFLFKYFKNKGDLFMDEMREYDAEELMNSYPGLSEEEAEKLEDMLQNLAEANSNKVMLNGKEVDVNSIEVEGGSYNDYSDVYISVAKFKDGTDLNNDEREELENLVDMGELANDSLSEAKKDKEEVEDITVDDTEVVDAPESDMMADESAEVSGIQSNLQAAYAEAKALGDEKLITQIANTITYFTKAHILDTAPINENMFPMLKRILR
jgi:hypothetical protein